MIFAARQLQQKCQEMRTHLYTTSVDLTKAFDKVNRAGLWKVMQKFSSPEHFTHMVHQHHDGMMARVTDDEVVSEAFALTNGVKQDCVLAPNLFSLMSSAMLTDAYRDQRPGIPIDYRTGGHLLNIRSMQAHSQVPFGCPEYTQCALFLQEAVFSTHRQHMMPNFTEYMWLDYARQAWEKITTSPLLYDYHRLLVNNT
ncbi:unnamed protein product [Dibothriocephalus latus]|uniref:Reverse transcriptase domain-containing protein n=1 Tax=Dibothriocephalus latus TaxID=60516 RepID=A0A3P7MBP6_DIBLA|nr:unnamed protein product [Dibothriocephalus latus]